MKIKFYQQVQILKACLLLTALGISLDISHSRAKANNLSGNLTVEINGFRNREGQACVSLFASSQGFPNNRKNVVQRQCNKITSVPLTLNFRNLKAGNYAVAIIHDTNGDGTLNRNDIGMPIEGYGFSRNPEIRTAAPKFNDAAVLIAGPNTNVQVQLLYLD
ncbi:DUF2141 domain-containing protein [Scytonema millei VB511283]|uniref:DUF2141 domain-containing protein n=2 Tax=Scytonema TaxID=1203 RepID=A0A9X5E1H3_9CYAN|nr:DUF2141 domain-containing protein [Scytonema millei VB511283]